MLFDDESFTIILIRSWSIVRSIILLTINFITMRVILIALSLCFSISMIGQKTDFRLASTSIKIGETIYSFQAYEGDPNLEILNCTYFNPSHFYNQASDETEWHVYDMFYSQSPSGFKDDNFQPFYFKNLIKYIF